MKNQFTTRWLIKSGTINGWLLFSLFLNVTASAQPSADPQDHIARTFINSLLNKEYKQAWNLLDPEVQKTTTLDKFAQLGKDADSLTKEYGQELMEFMRGFRTY